MNEIRLEGCRNDALLGYLKALGVIRIVAKQLDVRVRASWSDATLLLQTDIARDTLVDFLLNRYTPTPVVDPWNNSAGFDESEGKKDSGAPFVERVRCTTALRWQPYRRVVEFIFREFIDNGERRRFMETKDKGDRKGDLLRRFRETCPEEALAWLDAVVIIGEKGVAYPCLLGTGGNDGRLEFSVSFMARALEVVGEDPIPQSGALLTDALFDTSTGALVKAAIGQFSSRHAGGANATTGFDTEGLMNPWDFVLLIEGALMFSGGIGKRTGGERLSAPFSFQAVGGGYGSASDLEAQKETHGEVWLPVWSGSAGFPSIVDLFRKARTDLPTSGAKLLVRDAASASEAASAAVTAGVGLGVRSFERMAFVKRNGRSFVATGVGSIRVSGHADEAVALMTESVARWIGRARELKLAKEGRLQAALRRFDDALFGYAQDASNRSGSNHTARLRQAIVIALAEVEVTLSQKQPEGVAPLRYMNAKLLGILYDGSIEHRLASALACLGGERLQTRIRLDLGHYSIDAKSGQLTYDRSATPVMSADPERLLSAIAVRRARLACGEPLSPWLTARPSSNKVHSAFAEGASVADVACMLGNDIGGDVSLGRVVSLLAAFALIEPCESIPQVPTAAKHASVPAAFALMKLVMDHPRSRDARIPALLNAGHGEKAIALARQRATVLDFARGRWRDITDAAIAHPKRYAGALIVPLTRSVAQYSALISSAITSGNESFNSNAEAQKYLEQLHSANSNTGA